MLDELRGLTVVETGKNYLKFDNGLFLNIYDLNKINLVYEFEKTILESLNGKTISSNFLDNIYLKNLISLDGITSELYLKEDLSYDDLIGLKISIDTYNGEYLSLYVHFDCSFLIENSIKFEDCQSFDEILEYNENVVELLYFKINGSKMDIVEFTNNLNSVLY